MLVPCEQNVFGRRLKTAFGEFGLRTGSGRLFQQRQKAGVRKRNGYVSGWTMGRIERRDTEVPDRSGRLLFALYA